MQAVARELLGLYAHARWHATRFSADSAWQQTGSEFSYIETQDQLQAIQDVKRDMESARRWIACCAVMLGNGKTEVALRAAFKAVMDGRQTAVLSPHSAGATTF